MSEELITKRLHISGLTPSITVQDLSQKLGSFGKVQSLDGFGTLDALGEPRKFGYVTIETTKPKLARCMNLLSGVTWKGAKLRIGEAKLDFRERIAKEREEQDEPPRKKRRLPRGVHGTHAADMTLVTPENVMQRAGWHVTPLGRMIRPIRMRPSHPLPDTIDKAKAESTKKNPKKAKKPRVKPPPIRARRRTIDPTRWGSQHLKGVFLESGGILTPKAQADEPLESQETNESEDDTDNSSVDAESSFPIVEVPKPLPIPSTSSLRPLTPQPVTTQATHNSEVTDLVREKNATLGLLQSMFGDRSDDDWFGKESVGSDVDMEDVVLTPGHPSDTAVEPSEEDVTHLVNQPAVEPSPEDGQSGQTPSSTVQHSTKTKLKDLFAPKEQEAGFSLLGHLDLDLELEDEILDFSTVRAHVTTSLPEEPQRYFQTTSARTQAVLSIDSKTPLFFPLDLETRHASKGRVKDPFDVFANKGWDWRQFCRTETPEETKQWWEEAKGDLTRDWKRRHREAVKSRRRRGGNDGED